MELKLVPITEHNWRQAIFLTTDPERKIPLDEQWIASNAFSLLQCCYDKDWDCRLLVDGANAVGFAFYGYWREKDRYLLCRYMIDERHQNQGYGKRCLPLILSQIRMQYGCTDVYTTVDDENVHAVHLYTSAGFMRTDEMDEQECVFVLKGDHHE